MTQVQTMTNQELNRALMVALGCQVEEHSGTVFFFTILPNGNRLYHQLPDYAGEPAASLEVQTAAITKDGIQYLHNLSEIVEPDEPNYKQEDEVVAYTFEHTVKLLTATLRERAEAAYITLQGAKGDD